MVNYSTTFADDIILISHISHEFEKILNVIHTVMQPIGVNMHLGKTKVLFKNHAKTSAVIVNGKTFEH